jgi:hypothetical protein
VHVDLGRRVVSDQDDGQTWRASRLRQESIHPRQTLGLYLIAYAITIQNPGHQTNVTDRPAPTR